MQNPFESGQIKNYVLLYASVVVIMILFFIATSLFNDVPTLKKKVFSTTIKDKKSSGKEATIEQKIAPKFKLMKETY